MELDIWETYLEDKDFRQERRWTLDDFIRIQEKYFQAKRALNSTLYLEDANELREFIERVEKYFSF